MSLSAQQYLAGSILPGYDIEEVIFEGDPTLIYRARRIEDGAAVVLKCLASELPALELSASLKHEFEIAKRFDSSNIISIHGMEMYQNLPVLVLEDFGGESLYRLNKKRKFGLEEVLSMGVQIAQGLSEIHSKNIIHKDISLGNLVYNPDTKILKIIDFGISSSLTREQASIAQLDVVEASLPYISPEQTGRMNRSIDYRSDYYSMGAALYELLTGQYLYDVNTAIEWFHCHIAKQPPSVNELNPSVPVAVSNVIMKLLAKTAEDRYQSALGIQRDLQRCLDLVAEENQIEAFALALDDVPTRFQIPQRLYGRSNEVKQLLQSFDRAAQGFNALVFISGYSGIGKTCLIKEVYKPITERRGHFISGKFDQLKRDIPYSALVDALQNMVRQLLAEPEQELVIWKSAIQDSLGSNGQLMVDLIPELELIIGVQPPVPKLAQVEAEQRFQRVFKRFIQGFAQPSHPLVLCLDDLQWADVASLKIIETLSALDSGSAHLLIIGSYRDNEVSPSHGLMVMVKELRSRGVEIQDILLRPLDLDNLTQLISDTLSAPSKETVPLARLVLSKTEGNPFFAEEFLCLLHSEGLISFSLSEGKWIWDMEQIQSQNMTDNVVELMTEKLALLGQDTLELLKMAACIGNRFSLRVLAIVSINSGGNVARLLRPAMESGIIAPLGNDYRLAELEQSPGAELDVDFAFAHDRIQQAAYQLLDQSDRRKTHMGIGRLLLQSLSLQQQKERVFEIVNHLNIGVDLLIDENERRYLCQLNLDAGKRAKSASAYSAAVTYTAQGLALLKESSWQQDYNLTIDLYLEAVESNSLNQDYETMDRLLVDGLRGASNLLDEGRLRLIQVTALVAQGRLRESIIEAKSILKKLGHAYPKRSKKYHVIMAALATARLMRGWSIEKIEALPEMTDLQHQLANDIGVRVASAALFVEPDLLPLMIFKSAKVQLEYGHCPSVFSTWAAYGMIAATQFKQPERGLEYGQLSLNLVKKFQAKAVANRSIHVHNALIRHWKEPVINTLDPLYEAYRLGLEHGDFEYGALSIVVRQMNALDAGQSLKQWGQECLQFREEVKSLKQGMTLDYMDLWLQFHDNLTGNAASADKLVGRYFDVNQKYSVHQEAGDLALLALDNLMGCWVAYLFGNDEIAEHHANQLSFYRDSMEGFFFAGRASMIMALLKLRLLRQPAISNGRAMIREVARNLKKLEVWANHCPENFHNKYLLVLAETYRSKGQDLKASEMYEASMTQAQAQGFVQEQALAAELCGQMHWQAGRMTLAEPYLAKARDLYQLWGATEKVARLQQSYPQLNKVIRKNALSTVATNTSTIASFDVTALTKALKSIVDEKVHSRMIQAILATAVEFAGAQVGVIVLRNEDGCLCVEGEFSVERGVSGILQSLPVEQANLPISLINFVSRSHTSMVVHDAQQPNEELVGLEVDSYIQKHLVRSVMCLPILSGGDKNVQLIGLIYLENNLATGSFTQERFETLEIIGMAAAGTLELSRKAAFDGLTGLYNHEYFQNMLKQEFASARRYQRDLGLLLIDIDHFKQFNDSWGHQVGDLVLAEVARLIKETCRGSDVVARYGGEEIAVILPSSNLESSRLAAERVRKAIESLCIEHEGNSLAVTISLGLAMLEVDTDNKDQLIRRADEALYKSKAAGRNQLTVG